MPRFTWSNGHRCAVALTFDMDGETVPFVLDPPNARRRLSLLSESMYGPRVGMRRILELLDLYEIPATFFVPSFTAELHPDVLERTVAAGHEVGVHGYMHEGLQGLSDDDEDALLVRAKETLTRVTGHEPVGYRSPSWELKPRTPALLRHHGFLYDSSLMADDIPYRVPAGDGDLIELPVQWLLDDWAHFGFAAFPPAGNGIASQESVFEIWAAEFDAAYERGCVYVLTMHPFVTGRPSRMALLERLIRHMRGPARVWFASLEQIAHYCAETDAGDLIPFPQEVLTPPENRVC